MSEEKAIKRSANQVKTSPVAYTQDERENQIIAKCYALAEKRIDEGTASSSEIVFFLKLGSKKEQLEQELMKTQHELLEAKTEAIKSSKRIEELYLDAMEALSDYQGSDHSLDSYDVGGE